jgi:hypothetical protein
VKHQLHRSVIVSDEPLKRPAGLVYDGATMAAAIQLTPSELAELNAAASAIEIKGARLPRRCSLSRSWKLLPRIDFATTFPAVRPVEAVFASGAAEATNLAPPRSPKPELRRGPTLAS